MVWNREKIEDDISVWGLLWLSNSCACCSKLFISHFIHFNFVFHRYGLVSKACEIFLGAAQSKERKLMSIGLLWNFLNFYTCTNSKLILNLKNKSISACLPYLLASEIEDAVAIIDKKFRFKEKNISRSKKKKKDKKETSLKQLHRTVIAANFSVDRFLFYAVYIYLQDNLIVRRLKMVQKYCLCSCIWFVLFSAMLRLRNSANFACRALVYYFRNEIRSLLFNFQASRQLKFSTAVINSYFSLPSCKESK